ncbi:hypothetical protein K1X84_09235 [bacterium]|nr:hypothetical protein [bacterium]
MNKNKHFKISLLLIIFSCLNSCGTDDKNVLENTKWKFSGNDSQEYLHFTSNTIRDYFKEDDSECYSYSEINYTIDANKFHVTFGNEETRDFEFIQSNANLTIIDIEDKDTVTFHSDNFNANNFMICLGDAAEGQKESTFHTNVE